MSNSPFRELHVKIEVMIERTKARIRKRRYHRPSLTQEIGTERNILSLFFPLSRYDPTFAHITETTKILLRTCSTSQKRTTTHTTKNTKIASHTSYFIFTTHHLQSCRSRTPSRTKPSAISRTSYATTATTGKTSARSPLTRRS